MEVDNKSIKHWREWLSRKEASEYTGVGFSTLAKLRLKGGGPVYTKIGTACAPDGCPYLRRWTHGTFHLCTSRNRNSGQRNRGTLGRSLATVKV